jgi:hypothetical protein
MSYSKAVEIAPTLCTNTAQNALAEQKAEKNLHGNSDQTNCPKEVHQDDEFTGLILASMQFPI